MSEGGSPAGGRGRGSTAWPQLQGGAQGITRCGGLCSQVLQVQLWVVALGAGLD